MIYWETPKVFDHLGYKSDHIHYGYKIYQLKASQCSSIHNEKHWLLPLFFRWSIRNFARYWWRLWWWQFISEVCLVSACAAWPSQRKLSHVRKQRKKLRETARNLSCFLEMTSPALQAFENKDVAVRAWPGAAPRRGLKRHQHDSSMFRKQLYTLLQREKVNAQFPLSYISDISHQDWCSSGWLMKSIRAGAFFQN